MSDREMLEVALEEARSGLAEGGIPIGAALFSADAQLPGHRDGHDPGAVLILQRARAAVRVPKVVVGESVNFSGGIDWLRECGVEVVDLASKECVELLAGFIAAHPEVWREDIGER